MREFMAVLVAVALLGQANLAMAAPTGHRESNRVVVRLQAVPTATPAARAQPAAAAKATPAAVISLAAAPISSTVGTPEGSAIDAAIAMTPTETITDSIVPPSATEPFSATTPVDDAALDAEYASVLEGTIVANRTESIVRFFVEGQTYEVAPRRAFGVNLPRSTAVLNLFNCDASKTEADAGCFWDPYLLTQNGFYEVIDGAEVGQPVNLSLRAAGTPPGDQVWVQNRTGERETIIVDNQSVDLAPASVQEFAASAGSPVVVALRTCITQGDRRVCEWSPQGVDPGYYYGLVKTTRPGPNDTQVTSLNLEAVVASGGETIKPPPQATCRLRVPTLNVRGGPGLEFPIIAKVRGTLDAPASVVVIAFDGSKQWMQVAPRVAQDGWVTANPDFIICSGDLAALPVIGAALAAEPTPTVAPVVEAPPARSASSGGCGSHRRGPCCSRNCAG